MVQPFSHQCLCLGFRRQCHKRYGNVLRQPQRAIQLETLGNPTQVVRESQVCESSLRQNTGTLYEGVQNTGTKAFILGLDRAPIPAKLVKKLVTHHA